MGKAKTGDDYGKTDAKTIVIDPKDYRVDGRLLRRLWRLTTPYWRQKKHWPSWLLLSFGILIGPAWAYYSYWAAQKAAQQANALVAKDQPEFFAIYWLMFYLGVGQWVYGLLMGWLGQLMQVHWNRWTLRWMIDRYLQSRTYYDIAVKEDIDNPDERIQDNVGPVMGVLVGIPGMVIGTITGLIVNGLLLTQVNATMVTFVVVYSVVTMGIQMLIYIPQIKLSFDMVAAKADMRYGLLRVRDNAETIAFFRGESMEKKQIDHRIDRQIRMGWRSYYYGLVTGVLTHWLGIIWTLAPLFIIYPLYFTGKIEFGMIALATSAASNLKGAIQQIDDFFPMLANAAPSAVRLAQIVERCDEIEAAQKARPDEWIIVREGKDEVKLDDVSFATPGGERFLAHNLNLTVGYGDSLIIIGQTGVGKSSLLRAMAGLWNRGSGVLMMPPDEQCMFVPQKPYMMLGTLRDQLLYPRGDASLTDDELQAVLEQVCLPDLLAKHGGLSAEKDWSKVLSLGEQQRISFARVLISKPRFVFMDESTSAMDVPTENTVYQALSNTGVTFISVGHRETILKFHDRALRLMQDGAWEVMDARAIPLTEVQPLGAARDPDRDGAPEEGDETLKTA